MTSATRSPGSARSSRSSRWRARSWTASASRGRGVSAPRLARTSHPQRDRACVHRSADAQVRPAPGGAPAPTDSTQRRPRAPDEHRDRDGDRAPVREPAAARSSSAAGCATACSAARRRTSTSRSSACPRRGCGRCSRPSAGEHRRRELHRLQGRRHRRVAAAPRVEGRPRPRGFVVTGDPDMSPDEAARRRDFTINAISWDPLTDEYLDPFDGRRDLSSASSCARRSPDVRRRQPARAPRACSSPRASSCALDRSTRDLCRRIPLDDLPAERIWGEIEKLLLRARRPSIGFALALELGVVDRLFPELEALVGCPQEPEWHPEGDVWVHTLLVIDQARRRIDDLDRAATARGHARRRLPRPRQAGDDGVHRRPHPLARSRSRRASRRRWRSSTG